MMVAVFAGKPVIGISGGIGSGKSFVAALFGEFGGRVISSDQQVSVVYADPNVRRILRQWWGDEVITPAGDINRRLIATKIFADPAARRRLEELLHPRVAALRDAAMAAASDNSNVVAYIWDTPLLYETGLDAECDAVVFVDTPVEQRLQRVRQRRNWDEAELARRENSQWPLDRKKDLADYVISNTADAGFAREQVRAVLSRILTLSKQQRT